MSTFLLVLICCGVALFAGSSLQPPPPSCAPSKVPDLDSPVTQPSLSGLSFLLSVAPWPAAVVFASLPLLSPPPLSITTPVGFLPQRSLGLVRWFCRDDHSPSHAFTATLERSVRGILTTSSTELFKSLGVPSKRSKSPSWTFASVLFADAQSPPPLPQATICLTVTKKRERRTQHAAFAVDYYRHLYPHVNFSVAPVGVYEASGTTPQGLGRAIIEREGAGCTALVGPGSSPLSQAINVLVRQLWLCFSATSTQLSDKGIYRYFSRAVPSDAASTVGAAKLMIKFGWRHINSFCTDSTYGQSVTQGMSHSFTELGGSIELTRCVSNSATNQSIIAALDAMTRSRSKVVFAAVSTSDSYYGRFIDLVIRNGFDKKLIFFFSEAACSSAVHHYAAIEGSLCATFRIDQSVFGAFHTAYKARDTTATDRWFIDAGYPADFALDKTGTEVFAAYAVDATQFIMNGLNSYAQSVGAVQAAADFKNPAKMLDVVVHARKQTILHGVTGNITLDANGDRPSSDMVVFNGQPGGVAVVVANVTDTVSVASEIYWLASGFSSTPPRATPLPPSESNTVTTVAAASAGGAALLIVIIVVVGLVLFFAFRPKVRDTSRAPKDGDDITIAFTDIEKSTLMWSLHPQEMAVALDHHHRLIRESISKYGGYEVKTIGDSFMVAFQSPVNGMLFALDVQDRLFEFEWGSDVFDATYKDKLTYTSEELSTYDAHWRGIRVRVGVHTGAASVEFDEVARGYDCYGPAVNCAARIEALGHGGQVLVSDEVRTAARLNPRCSQWTGAHKWTESVDFKAMGKHEVHGIPTPIVVHQAYVGSERYWGRTFPPLRSHLNHNPHEQEGEGEELDLSAAEFTQDEADLTNPELLSCDGSMSSFVRPPVELQAVSINSTGSPISPKSDAADTAAGPGARRVSAAAFFDPAGPTPKLSAQHAALVAAYKYLPPQAVKHVRAKRGGRLNYAGKMMFAEAVTCVLSLFSIMTETDKIALVQKLCKAWRVQYDPTKAVSCTTVDAATRARPAGHAYKSKSEHSYAHSHSDSGRVPSHEDAAKVFTAYAEPQLYVLLQKLVWMRQTKMAERAAAERKRTARGSAYVTTPPMLSDPPPLGHPTHHSAAAESNDANGVSSLVHSVGNDENNDHGHSRKNRAYSDPAVHSSNGPVGTSTNKDLPFDALPLPLE